MSRGKLTNILFSILVFLIAVLIGGQASAATNTFQYNIEFSGGTAPSGPTPWLTATFDDSFGGANTVRLTMSAGNLQGNEFVNDWYFNFDPGLNPGNLSFIFVSGSAGAADNVFTDFNAFKADGDGFFDISFDYTESTTGDRFTFGETATYDITYTSTIDVTSFDFFSVMGGGQGSYLAAAKVQGIAHANCSVEDPNCESGWVGVVPEPVSSTLFIIGGATLGFRRFRKKFKK